MPKMGNVEVEVGDLLRRNTDDREGTVASVSAAKVTVRFNSTALTPEGETTTGPTSDFYYNPWDAKYKNSGRTPPKRKPSAMG